MGDSMKLIKSISDFSKRLFCAVFNLGRGTQSKSIMVGNAESTLVLKNRVSYQHNGRSLRAERTASFEWIRRKGAVRILPRSEPNPHIIIVGMSGLGKSTLLKSMMIDIKGMGVPLIAFDSHNEHEEVVAALSGRVYDSRHCGINIFDLDGTTVSERIAELTSLFRSVYSLGYIQATKLSECLWYMYRKAGCPDRSARELKRAPTIGDLLSELSIFIKNAKGAQEANTLTHLKGRISLLNNYSFNSSFVDIGELKRGTSSFSLAALGSSEMQLIYIHELLRRLYNSMKRNTREQGLSMYLVLDEAQFLISTTKSQSDIIRKIIEEGRKYGVGVIVATHLASGLDRRITANASTLISFYSREPSETNYIANAMGGNDPYKRDAIRRKDGELRQNEAIMVSALMKNPITVNTPKMGDLIATIEKGREALPADGGVLEYVRRPVEYGKVVEEFGQRGAELALKDGGIAQMDVSEGGVRQKWLMKRRRSPSIEHEVSVKRISARLTGLHIKHYVNTNTPGPDLVAYVEGGKVAVEYETGKKGRDATAEMLRSRAAAFKSTLVFANSDALKFYRDYFSGNGVAVLGLEASDREILEALANIN